MWRAKEPSVVNIGQIWSPSQVMTTSRYEWNILELDVKTTNKQTYAASAYHCILLYRFIMDDGTTHENYHDDYENGPGRWLQRHMRENHIQSAVFVITRRIQEGHIVPQQFSIMENLINEFANSLDA